MRYLSKDKTYPNTFACNGDVIAMELFQSQSGCNGKWYSLLFESHYTIAMQLL